MVLRALRYFDSLPTIVRLAVMMYVRFPLSLRQVEDLLYERGILPRGKFRATLKPLECSMWGIPDHGRGA